MQKNNLVGIAALFIVLAGVILYAATKPAPAKAPGTAAPIALSGTSYAEHAQYYDIAANYASSTPLAEPANTAAVTMMKNFVGSTVAQFLADGKFDRLTPEDVTMMGFDKGRKEKLQILYMIASSPNTVTYIFTTYMDTLGAHGNTFFNTFTFNTDSGKPVALADLFLPGSDYLGTLSSISRAKLPGVIGKDYDMTFIQDGTTPEDKNFSAFFPDNKNLDILFPPYQVAPYSDGPQTLQIPRSELSSILKPEYR